MQNNETMTLNEKINGIMEEVYKKMSISETCDALVEKIANKFFIFAEEQTNEKGESAFLTVDVRKVLSDAQMENIKQIIIASIRSNKADSDAWLEQFAAFNPEEPKKQFADGADIAEEEEVEEAPEPKKEVVLDKDQIKEMVQKGMTQKDIAEEIGVSQGKVQRFIAKNDLKKRRQVLPVKINSCDILTEYDREVLGATSKYYKKCGQCGETFYVASPGEYVFARNIGRGGAVRKVFYCGYSCFQESKK